MNAHGTPILKTLLEFIADFYGRDPEEMTAIYHVARSKTPDYALMLLEHNADIHAVGICHAERGFLAPKDSPPESPIQLKVQLYTYD
ncbi:hypothetical protein L207DRAFT_577825 [Hyaloscypha variabilis F]|uniref:Uncharacterized protein n=1 Tax=Hyaloscypha variabilis (strain UAMH 11265 / GT02V1 / F) TaxID=1149755 RepID=A0A2J6S283_HYAVF|nr:hypothetical protein L207DRAFT_577825 [Hyaloscypha variabilis F]